MDKKLILYWLAMAKTFRLSALTCATYAKMVALSDPELAMAFDYEYSVCIAECRDCINHAIKIKNGGI